MMLFVRNFLYSSLFFITVSSISQTVRGKIVDAKQKPISNVTVSLLKAKDSSLLKAELTDTSGRFEINTKELGDAILFVNSEGFEKMYSGVFTLKSNQAKDVKTIALKDAVGQLKEVVVQSAKKPMIEVKADKTVFNVESSINATGSNAMELLRKSPGVSVDKDDNISMMGKNGTKIYIDGKISQLDATNLAAFLKSLSSSDIEAIEMISNPSAKYDASGNAGIINIKLKKNKKFGTNGSVEAGFVQGVTPKGNGALNLNYRDKKVNLFGSIGGNIGNNQNTISLQRTQTDTFFNQFSTNIDQENNGNVKGGIDYFVDKKTTLGFIGTYNYSKNDFTSEGTTPITYQPTGTFVKTLRAKNTKPASRTNANVNLNYKYTDTSGNEWNVDADYGYFRGRSSSFQPNNYYDLSNVLLYASTNSNYTPTDINIYTVKADGEHRFGKAKFEFGAKFSYVKTDNTLDYYNVDANNVFTKNLDQSNTFSYTENINAAYLNFQRPLSSKINLQAGLRLEQTNKTGNLTRANNTYQQGDDTTSNYLDVFPSGALTYTINAKNTLNLTFSRRIDRPSYQDLNPFEIKLDELTYLKGNARLQPQYTNSVELTHTFMGFVNTKIGYSHISDYATQVTDTTNNNATYVQQRNLATVNMYTFNLSTPIPITKWWFGFANFWCNYQQYNGTINKTNLDVAYTLYGAFMQHTYTLGKGYSAELSGWLNGPGVWGATWKTKAQGAVDFGVQKQLLEKKATLKLSVTDIFHTAPWYANVNFGGVVINGHGTWESRTFRASFSYRFGSSQIKSARERSTGLENEAKRIKK